MKRHIWALCAVIVPSVVFAKGNCAPIGERSGVYVEQCVNSFEEIWVRTTNRNNYRVSVDFNHCRNTYENAKYPSSWEERLGPGENSSYMVGTGKMANVYCESLKVTRR